MNPITHARRPAARLLSPLGRAEQSVVQSAGRPMHGARAVSARKLHPPLGPPLATRHSPAASHQPPATSRQPPAASACRWAGRFRLAPNWSNCLRLASRLPAGAALGGRPLANWAP